MKKRMISCILILVIALSLFTGTSFAQINNSQKVKVDGQFFIDKDFNNSFSNDDELLEGLQYNDKLSIPDGYGIPSDYIVTNNKDKTKIPLRQISDITIEIPAQAVDMTYPMIPPAYFCVKDAKGNSLDSSLQGNFIGTNALRTIGDALIIEPTSLKDGYVTVPFRAGNIEKKVDIYYSFSNMTSMDKIKYSLSRGWISESEYQSFVSIANNTPQLLPEEYKASRIIDDGDSFNTSESTITIQSLPDLSGYTYYDTSDGKIRVYAYDSQGTSISATTAQNMRNLFNSYSIRSNVLNTLSTTSIPQEDTGKTVVYFNTSLGSGGAVYPNGDGTYHIEVGTSAGRYVLTHEYTHVVQQNKYNLAYTANGGKGWWMEGTADWIGKVLAGNDHYVSRLTTLQSAPWLAYDSGSISDTTSRIYGTAALAMFLQARNVTPVKNSYVYGSQYTYMRDAINAGLSVGLNSEFTEYAKRMYRPSTQMTSIVSYASGWSEANYTGSGLLGSTEPSLEIDIVLNVDKRVSMRMGIFHFNSDSDALEMRRAIQSAPLIPDKSSNYFQKGSTVVEWSFSDMSEPSISTATYNKLIKLEKQILAGLKKLYGEQIPRDGNG